MPWVNAIEQEYNWKLFTPDEIAQGYYVKFLLNGLLRGDMASRAAFYKSMFEVAGLSPNRILQLEDEEPIGPEGDTYFVSNNVKPLDQALNPPAPPPASVPATTEEQAA
jgi:phage portal protein BeeE